jgi:hypothetical protein
VQPDSSQSNEQKTNQWTYGTELWGCASHSNIEIIQRYQSKILRTLSNAPWYVTNHILHSDLHIPYVREVFQERIATHRTAIASHPNPLMVPLLHLPPTRRLKRRRTFDGTHPYTTAKQNQPISS